MYLKKSTCKNLLRKQMEKNNTNVNNFLHNLYIKKRINIARL